MLQNFARAIETRRAAGQTVKSTLVSIDKTEIVDARVVGRDGSLTIRFAAKMISATLDAAGTVIEGSELPWRIISTPGPFRALSAPAIPTGC